MRRVRKTNISERGPRYYSLSSPVILRVRRDGIASRRYLEVGDHDLAKRVVGADHVVADEHRLGQR